MTGATVLATLRRRRSLARMLMLVALAAVTGVSGGCSNGRSASMMVPSALAPLFIGSTQAAGYPDEPAPGSGPTVTAPTGATGRGALARRLPTTARGGWGLSLAQISARRGVYLVTTTPPAGRPTTVGAAAHVLAAAARAMHDDPRAYRPLVPMSALAGAHTRGRSL